MNDRADRRLILLVAGLLIGGAVLASSMLAGGQSQRILSTVGNAIDATAQGGSGSGGESGGGAGSGSDSGQADPAQGAGSGNGTGTTGQIADLAAGPPALLIVRTGKLELEVAGLDAALRAGDAAVVASGGYVSDSRRAAEIGTDVAEVTYRIPSATWDATLATLRGLAAKIRSESIATEEVSGQVVDLTARIANLRATEAALQAIMAKAARISDVLDVQEQLTTTRGEIERLVGDKEHLEARAAFGSLTVTLRLPPVVAPAVTPKPATGWDPANDVARATGKLVRIGQTTTSVGIWLGIVGLPLVIGGIGLAFVAWQVTRLTRWLIRRREAAAQGA